MFKPTFTESLEWLRFGAAGFLSNIMNTVSSPNVWRHHSSCNHFTDTASAFLRHSLQVELIQTFLGQMGSRSMSHLVSAGRVKDGRLSQDKTWFKLGAPERNKCCVMGNGAGWWPLSVHKNATSDKTQTLSRCLRTVKLLSVKRGGRNVMSFEFECAAFYSLQTTLT